MEHQPLLLSTKKAAKKLGVSEWTLNHERRLGRIDAVRIGRRWFYRIADIEGMALTTREKRALVAAAAGRVN
jgi:hypothetical protein